MSPHSATRSLHKLLPDAATSILPQRLQSEAMKTSSVAFACIAAATAGLSGATTFAVIADASHTAVGKCDIAELIAKLLPLLGDDNLPKCQKDAGFTFFPFSGLPSDAQLAKLCKAKACQSLLVQVIEAELPSCKLEYQGQVYNIKDTVDFFATKCLPPSSHHMLGKRTRPVPNLVVISVQTTFKCALHPDRWVTISLIQWRVRWEYVRGAKVALAGLVALHVGRHLRDVAAREQQRDEQVRVPGASDQEPLADLHAQAPGDKHVHEAEQQAEHAPGTRRHRSGVLGKRATGLDFSIVITVLWEQSAVVRRPPGRLAAEVVLRQIRRARAVVHLHERDDHEQELHDRDREEAAEHGLVAVEAHARRDLRERYARTERGHEAVRHQVREAVEQPRAPGGDADAALIAVSVRTGRGDLDRVGDARAFPIRGLGLDGQVDRSHRA